MNEWINGRILGQLNEFSNEANYKLTNPKINSISIYSKSHLKNIGKDHIY